MGIRSRDCAADYLCLHAHRFPGYRGVCARSCSTSKNVDKQKLHGPLFLRMEYLLVGIRCRSSVDRNFHGMRFFQNLKT